MKFLNPKICIEAEFAVEVFGYDQNETGEQRNKGANHDSFDAFKKEIHNLSLQSLGRLLSNMVDVTSYILTGWKVRQLLKRTQPQFD